MTNGPGGRFRRADGLTDKQRAFVLAVANGRPRKDAAIEAGYTDGNVDSYRLLQLPHVVDAIRAERERLIVAEGASEAFGILRDVMRDKRTLPAVRVKAATWILEAAGHGPRRDPAQDANGAKPLSEMTIAELEAFVSAGSEGLRKLREQRERTIDAEPIDALPAPDALDDARDASADPPGEPGSIA